MNFKTDTITIEDFFINKKYKIPRYQREYSWGKTQLEDFYSDIISNIVKIDDKFKNQEYFFGTVILSGDMKNKNKHIEIIDGQQRITTITIFLSVMSDILYNHDRELSDRVWNFIIAKDRDGNPYNVMENDTASEYFQHKIQKRIIKNDSLPLENSNFVICEKEIQKKEGNLSQEQKLVKNAYDFFMEKLKDENLSAEIFDGSSISLVEKLKLVRDQLLGSTFIYIISEDTKHVNTIFENINSKGLQLSSIDLIKNEIFSVENSTVPLDDAKSIWTNIKNNLVGNGEYISISKFYRYFWLSRYTYSTEAQLYEKFKKEIRPEKYIDFLKELEEASEIYSQIINPKDEYFRISSKGNHVGKDDLCEFVESLRNIQNVLRIEQVQVLLITLIDRYRKGYIKFKTMKSTIKFLEEFHFIYNGILKSSTNTLVNKYGNPARAIYSNSNPSEISNELNELRKTFIGLIPKDNQEFVEVFSKLEYSSDIENMGEKERKNNVFTKYVIYKFEELLSRDKKKNFNKNAATIEHIEPESSKLDNPNVLNIGNLVLLEKELNNRCSTLSINDKMQIYAESEYCSVAEFLVKYPKYDTKSIEGRSQNIANEMYTLITSRW